MLDKPVPNPLAKNPKVHTHKVFAAIGLILIGVIIGVSLIWWYVQKQEDFESLSKTDNSNKTTKYSAQPKYDKTADWKSFTSAKWGFSLKYPKDWDSAADTDTGALVQADTQEYGHPQVYIVWKQDQSKNQLYDRISSYKVDSEVKFDTDMDIPVSSGSAKKYIQDTYERLADVKVDGTKALRYTIDLGYKDVGVNESYNVLVKRDGKFYLFSITPFDLTLGQAITKLDLILSTFKFPVVAKLL